MARLRPPLGALRDGVSPARRPGHAARALGSHGRQLRFRGGHRSRLAHHHLPALFRRRRNLLRLRHGADAGDSDPQNLRPGRFHHRPPLAEFRQSHAGDRLDRRLRLRDRSLHGLVRRQSLRSDAALEPPPRALFFLVLLAPHLQSRRAAVALDSKMRTNPVYSSSFRSSSWSACGWSVSSSSSSA